MLAGLSIMYCLRTPPSYWASAAGTKANAISNPAIAAARRLSIIRFLPLIDRLRCGGLPSDAFYLSSQTSSIRQLLKMLLTMVVSPFTCGRQQMPPRL